MGKAKRWKGYRKGYWTDGLVTVYSCPPYRGKKVCLGRMTRDKADAIQTENFLKKDGCCVWYQFK